MVGTDFNPYAAPEHDAVPSFDVPDETSQVLAGRGTRLGAAIIDGLATSVVNLPLQYALGFFDGFPEMQLGFGELVLATTIGFAVWLAIQLHFLRSGQTLGKRMTSIRMVDHQSGQVPPLGRLVLMRYLPINVASIIPFVGSFLVLIDTLFIFSGERRCIHDRIAGTKVVTARSAV